MTKIIALGLILKEYPTKFQKIFLPFLPILDKFAEVLPNPALFQYALSGIFFVAAALLFCNRYVRSACIVLSLVMFTAILSSQYYHGNNKLFCACIFFLTGLQGAGVGQWVYRYQLSLMYFGAGLNKILSTDWLSGQYFDHWFGVEIGNSFYGFLSAVFPPFLFAKLMAWSSIITEFLLCIGFLLKRYHYYAIWLAIVFHSTILTMTGQDYGVFTIALFASYLAFVKWPDEVKVAADKSSSVSNNINKLFGVLDQDDMLRWRHSSGEVLVAEVNGKVYRGIPAFKVLLLLMPATYFILTALLCIPNKDFRSTLVIVLIVFFSPLIDMILNKYEQIKE